MAVLRMGEILKMDKKARETKMNELRPRTGKGAGKFKQDACQNQRD